MEKKYQFKPSNTIMIPIKEIRDDPERVSQAIAQKGEDIEIKKILELDKELRFLIKETEGKKAKRNSISQDIAKLKLENVDAANLIADMKVLSSEIKTSDATIAKLKENSDNLLRWIPNIPHDSVPIGKNSTENKVVRYWGESIE